MSKSTLTPLANKAGFTLIEVIVTVTVIGIIAAIAAPNISLQLANQRIKSTTATLDSALKEARSESLIRRRDIVVDYKNNSTTAGSIYLKVEVHDSSNMNAPPLFFSKPPFSPDDDDSNTGNSGGGEVDNSGETPSGSNSSTGKDNNDSNSGSKPSKPSEGQDNNSSSGGQASGGTKPGNTGGSNEGGSSSNGPESPVIPAPIPNPKLGIVATFKFDSKTTIKSTPQMIKFDPKKRVDSAVTYTICDSNKSASARQVIVNKLGNISSQLGGSC